jgi:hypothetical protein
VRGVAGRGGAIRKGGNPVLATPGAEVADQIAQGGVAVAETLGDLTERALLDEIGAEGLVAPVQGIGGLEEEAEGARIIHDLDPVMSVDFRWTVRPRWY